MSSVGSGRHTRDISRQDVQNSNSEVELDVELGVDVLHGTDWLLSQPLQCNGP